VGFCATQTDANAVTQEMGVISQLHPSRVLLLVGDTGSGGAELEAYVSTQCYLIGGGRQVCSEHVTVNAATGAGRRLPSVARPLLIGDLPTSLWWVSNQAPPAHGPLFAELAGMADHLVYDSLGWADPVRGVVNTADWVLDSDTQQIASDLAWRRLKPWRRLISQALDPTVEPGALDSIRTITVEHGPHALPQAWLLIGWLACRLGWRPLAGKVSPGVEVTWAFQAPNGQVSVTVRRLSDGSSDLRSVAVGWGDCSENEHMRFTALGGGRLAVTDGSDNEPSRILAAPELPRAQLVARQLPDLGRDALFLDTLDVSRIMAKSLL